MTDIPEDALARLQKRVDDWKHNSDTATVSVKLGDLRAAVAYLAERAAQAERIRELEDFAAWVETWVSQPVGAFSVLALDGLFSMSRDRLTLLRAKEETR